MKRVANEDDTGATPIRRKAADALPHDLDIERAVIASMLDHRASIDTAQTLVTAEAFYSPAHATIYDAIIALWAEGSSATHILVSARLGASGMLDAVGGGAYLLGFHGEAPAVAVSGRIEPYCHALLELAYRRKVIVAGLRAVDAARQGGEIDLTFDELRQVLGHTDSGGEDDTWQIIPLDQHLAGEFSRPQPKHLRRKPA